MATSTIAIPSTAASDRRHWVTLGLLCVAQLMLILDVTVVNVALPDIGADLHLQRTTLTWMMTAYTLAFGGLMLLGGRLADVFDPRRILLAGLALFTSASLLAGLAGNAELLLVGRVAQGVGAALLSPAALSLVATTFDGAQRDKALGVWAAIGGAGSALGVILGGVLTSTAGWRWVFFINVPIGAALLLVLPRLVTARAARGVRGAVDLPGAVLVTAATGAVIFGLINAGSHGWLAASTVTALAAGALLYATFVGVERLAESPLMDVRLLARRPVAAGAVLMLVATGLLVGGFFLGSFYLQHERGYSALRTGLAFLPIAVATVLGAHTASRVVAHLGARTVAGAGLASAALGAGVAAMWLGPVPLVVGLSLAALGIGATFVTAFGSALAGVEAHEAGLRSGIVNTSHELGGAIGVAVLSSVAGAALIAADAGTHGFTRAFTVSAVAALVAAGVAAFALPAGKLAGGGGRAH